MKKNTDSALKHEGYNDYVLTGDYCWITVGDLSVRLRRLYDHKVGIDVFPLDAEGGPAITSTEVPSPKERLL